MSKKIKIKLLADRVLVMPTEAQQKTASGILLPDTVKEKTRKGQVIAVGPGKKEEPITVKTEDFVLYGEYSGREAQIGQEKYLIMRESDIYGVLQ